MDFFSLFVIAISLTFDTFAVSITTGLVVNHIKFKAATRIAIVLAFVQALMPLIGWLIGSVLKTYIVNYDHWIAFILLALLGIK